MDSTTRNFLELYFETIDENIEEITNDLQDHGSDLENSRNKILQMIRRKKAEFKKERGRVLQHKIIELIKKKADVFDTFQNEEQLAIAARKLGKLDKNDIANIKKDAALLEDIKKIIKGGDDGTGKTGI